MSEFNVVYEPNRYLGGGFLQLWRHMLRDLFGSAELGYRLFVRDLTAKYKQSLFGVLWVVFLPLFAVSVFVVMSKSGVLNTTGTKVPYTVFALFGITIWTLFSGTLSAVAGVVGQSSGFITKINFPRIALIMSPLLVSLLDFFVRLFLLCVTMTVYDTLPDVMFFMLPIMVLPVVLLACGLGMMFAVVGTVFKDIPNFLNLFLSVAMFLMPVAYPLPTNGLLRTINMYNPLYYLLDGVRTVFFEGVLMEPVGYFMSVAISFLVLLVGWRFYHVAIARIVEKV